LKGYRKKNARLLTPKTKVYACEGIPGGTDETATARTVGRKGFIGKILSKVAGRQGTEEVNLKEKTRHSNKAHKSGVG